MLGLKVSLKPHLLILPHWLSVDPQARVFSSAQCWGPLRSGSSQTSLVSPTTTPHHSSLSSDTLNVGRHFVSRLYPLLPHPTPSFSVGFLTWRASSTLPPGSPQAAGFQGPANTRQAESPRTTRGPYHGKLCCCRTLLLDQQLHHGHRATNCHLRTTHTLPLIGPPMPRWPLVQRVLGGPRPRIQLLIGCCSTHGVWHFLIGCGFGGKTVGVEEGRAQIQVFRGRSQRLKRLWHPPD